MLMGVYTNGTGPPFLELKLLRLDTLMFMFSILVCDLRIEGEGELLLILEMKDCCVVGSRGLRTSFFEPVESRFSEGDTTKEEDPLDAFWLCRDCLF